MKREGGRCPRGGTKGGSSDPDTQSAGLIRFGLVSEKDLSRKSSTLVFFFFIFLVMPSISVTRLFLLLALLHLATSLPVRDEEEVESFLSRLGHLNAPWSRMNSDALLEARLRQLLVSAGLDRRRQLGDIEFSNRYAEFLRSKAKHSSVCAFLRRMQSVKKSGVGGDVEKVNLLLKQYMCPYM